MQIETPDQTSPSPEPSKLLLAIEESGPEFKQKAQQFADLCQVPLEQAEKRLLTRFIRRHLCKFPYCSKQINN